MFSFDIINHYTQTEGKIFYSTEKANAALNKIKAQKDEIGLFSVCDNDTEIKQAKEIATEIKSKYKKLIIFGIGGSALGGQALCGSKFYEYFNKDLPVEIIFIDNIHYHNFSIFLEGLDFATTAFLTISKSGGTTETLSQILVTLDYFDKRIKEQGADNFYFLVEDDEEKPLHKIATSLNRPIIPHSKSIGGRYSCFTAVSLIPAYLAGVDIDKLILGAKNMLDDFLHSENSLVSESGILLHSVMSSNIGSHVFIPYLQRLYQGVYWYAQLLAESLGKDGKGMTPIKALGSVDQHSQLQLYLDGPKDKFFTFITQHTAGIGNKIKVPDNLKQQLDFLDDKYLGDVINANQDATIESLKESGALVREFRFLNFDDESYGQLLMFFMLETILLGYMLDVNPFDQPAVEVGKKKAKAILRGK